MTTNTDGSVTMTDADLNLLRDKVRMEERGKLATRIDQLEATEIAYHEMKARLTTLEAETVPLREEVETLRKSVSTDKKLDVQKLIEEVRANAVASLQATTEQRISELSRQLETLTTENRRLALSSYKARRIAEEQAAGAKFILELVHGDTETEIDASITQAKQVYSKHFPSATPGQPGGQPPTSAGTTPAAAGAGASAGARGPSPVAIPAAGDAAAPAPVGGEGRGIAETVAELRAKHDLAGYAKVRADLKRAAAEEHAMTGTNIVTR